MWQLVRSIIGARRHSALTFLLSACLLLGGCIDWNSLYGAHCGDGRRSEPEQCDDGNTHAGDGCSPQCTLEPPSCGDGRVSGQEECDDANEDNSDACLNNCRAARCGDSQIWTAVEDCDDGNTHDGDGCSSTCRFEKTPCGDGKLQPGEQCDDHNTESGDGCSSTCTLEAPPELCGNGRLDTGEACDDGDRDNGNSCLNGCSLAACGDGYTWRGVEECDDGNTDNGDSCSKTCLACRQSDGAFFRPANGHCYRRAQKSSTLSEATADCDALGGYLWTTTSLTEAKDVNKVLNNGAAPIWLSFRTVAAPAPFSWPTGESIQYQAWAQNQPSDVNLSCVLQTSDATFTPFWQSAACTEKHDYVCETEPALVFAATHHAYHLHTRFRPWAEARDACAASGGHLLTIESAAEQAFISRYFAVEIWLGASRQSDGSFRWLTGLALDYSAFAKGQPDNSAGKENCLVDWASHAWNDLDCTVSRRFVCEFD